MLLFMNANILDDIDWHFCSYSPSYDFLQSVSLKQLMYFGLEKGDIDLCCNIRDALMDVSSGNLLIFDEHNALWRKFSSDSRSWPRFFRIYGDIWMICLGACGFLIAGSQHHQFEDYLPSGYNDCIRYFEPLSLDEYNMWTSLQDYPIILRRHSADVLELNGSIPRMIAIMVSLAMKYFTESFDTLRARFITMISSELISRHNSYMKTLTSDSRKSFYDMLYKLFMDCEVPMRDIVVSASYRHQGLLIVKDNMYLRFYNNIAHDILLSCFIERFTSEIYFTELVRANHQARNTIKDVFEELFFLWFIEGRKQVLLYSDTNPNKHLTQSSQSWVRLDKEEFNLAVVKFTYSSWILLSKQYLQFNYIYVDMETCKWHIYFFQVSVYSFDQCNRSSTIESALKPSTVLEEKQNWYAESPLITNAINNETEVEQSSASVSKSRKGRQCERHENKEKPEKSQLTRLLKKILDEDFTIVLEKDPNNQFVDFKLFDTHVVDCRDRVSIVYVTPLPYNKAKGVSSVPKYMEFLCREGFPENFQSFLQTDDQDI